MTDTGETAGSDDWWYVDIGDDETLNYGNLHMNEDLVVMNAGGFTNKEHRAWVRGKYDDIATLARRHGIPVTKLIEALSWQKRFWDAARHSLVVGSVLSGLPDADLDSTHKMMIDVSPEDAGHLYGKALAREVVVR